MGSEMETETESKASRLVESFTRFIVATLAASGLTPTGRFKSTRTVPFQSLTPTVDLDSIKLLIKLSQHK